MIKQKHIYRIGFICLHFSAVNKIRKEEGCYRTLPHHMRKGRIIEQTHGAFFFAGAEGIYRPECGFRHWNVNLTTVKLPAAQKNGGTPIRGKGCNFCSSFKWFSRRCRLVAEFISFHSLGMTVLAEAAVASNASRRLAESAQEPNFVATSLWGNHERARIRSLYG